MKAYHDSMSRLDVDELELLLARILSLFVIPSGKILSDQIAAVIREVLDCDLPFDSSIILNEMVEGEMVDTHVDFGLCPWKTCSGKTDHGNDPGVNTSVLGKFYHRLDRSVLTGKQLLFNI